MVDRHHKYLGLQASIGSSHAEIFSYIWDPMELDHRSGEHNLSRDGKAFLLKVVLSSITTYVMSCFEVTKRLVRRLKIVICSYLFLCHGLDFLAKIV